MGQQKPTVRVDIDQCFRQIHTSAFRSSPEIAFTQQKVDRTLGMLRSNKRDELSRVIVRCRSSIVNGFCNRGMVL